MQDYYRLLGISRLATPSEIKRAYQQLATRRAPATDPAAQEQWQAVQSGYELLRDPARRPAYDAWLAQQPDTRSGATRARDARRAQSTRMAHGFRWVVWALLAGSMLIILDWALPTQRYDHEQLLSQATVQVGASMSDQQTMYDMVTPHATFRLDGNKRSLLNEHTHVAVARTLLLHVVRRVLVPGPAAAQQALVPQSGAIYNSSLLLLPWLLLLLTAGGLWPTLSPEVRLNLALASILVAVLTGVVILFF